MIPVDSMISRNGTSCWPRIIRDDVPNNFPRGWISRGQLLEKWGVWPPMINLQSWNLYLGVETLGDRKIK